MTGHVVLCGLNELGYQTLEELHRLGEEVVVVARAPSEEFADRARALGATLVDGNYRHEQALRSARVQRATALVITEDDDVGNFHAAGRPRPQPAPAHVQPGARPPRAAAVPRLPGAGRRGHRRARLRLRGPAPGPAAAPPGRRALAGGAARPLLADRRLRVLAAVLLTLCASSVLIFARFDHLDWADAIYFTITVVTTAVGLGRALSMANASLCQ